MEKNISKRSWEHIFWKREGFIKALVMTLHNRME